MQQPEHLPREGDGRARRPPRAKPDARQARPRRRGDGDADSTGWPRSTFDLFAIVKRIVDAKAQFRSMAEPWADTGTRTGRLMIAVLGGLADVERDLIRTRTAEGRSRVKARGQQMGRPPHSHPRHSRKKPPDAARAVLRFKNSPAATTSAYPPFAARHAPHDLTLHRCRSH